ncbi:MAG: hypothetical protein ABI405_02540 [Parafilimonas sp.]
MKINNHVIVGVICLLMLSSSYINNKPNTNTPKFTLTPSAKFYFKSFVDCNMAEAWVGDTFRIFPGKYGEDPVWGFSKNLKFADGKNADEAFLTIEDYFKDPVMPLNVQPTETGLHGAVWFETIYQDKKDITGKTLFAVYHNENYPSTFPYNAKTGEGYLNVDWPQGLTDSSSAAAVCRIGIMKSVDGGRSWVNNGIFIEDLQPRMILKPHNKSVTFAGGVGDPSAVVSGNYLYLFYGEYGYHGNYNAANYDPLLEWSGQCISIARISLNDLDNPVGKAKRWNGKSFNAAYNDMGLPVKSLQIPFNDGGGPASSPESKFYWGPSVSWNTYLNCWVMLMARAEGPSWKGGSIWISFNKNADLNTGDNSQNWSKPQMLLNKPGHIIWYPSLQPTKSASDIKNKNTCLKLEKEARLFFKDMHGDSSEYVSEYKISFEK